MRRAAVAALSAAACACSGAAPSPAAPETGPEANAAIAQVKECTQGELSEDGYMMLVEQATAQRDPGRAGAWIVTIPPGAYKGRLPPPGPGTSWVVHVDLVAHTCSLPERKR